MENAIETVGNSSVNYGETVGGQRPLQKHQLVLTALSVHSHMGSPEERNKKKYALDKRLLYWNYLL